MLVLSRKAGERIVIDDTIEITVLEVQGGRIRLGVSAPRETRIERKASTDGSDGPGSPTQPK